MFLAFGSSHLAARIWQLAFGIWQLAFGIREARIWLGISHLATRWTTGGAIGGTIGETIIWKGSQATRGSTTEPRARTTENALRRTNYGARTTQHGARSTKNNDEAQHAGVY